MSDAAQQAIDRLTAATGGRLRAQITDLGSRGEEYDARVDTLTWDDALAAMSTGALAGSLMFQQFVCEEPECRAIQTMPVPNHAYIQGRCEECGHLTDLRQRGFGVIGFLPEPEATPEQTARFHAVMQGAAAELRARPDNRVLRAQGREPIHKVHKAPCGNCGQPWHKGPCKIRAQGGRRRIR